MIRSHFCPGRFDHSRFQSETQLGVPCRGGQTELISDQTIFERTHVPGALELHGLEKASSALLSGQWSGTCLIRGHFGLGWSDQRQFQAHTSPGDQVERIFFEFFVFLLKFVVSGKS